MYTVQEWVSGNGRNKCAGVFKGTECVASYHVRDYGPRYLQMAKGHAKDLNDKEPLNERRVAHLNAGVS